MSSSSKVEVDMHMFSVWMVKPILEVAILISPIDDYDGAVHPTFFKGGGDHLNFIKRGDGHAHLFNI